MLTFQSKSGSFGNIKAPIKNRNSRDGVRNQAPVLNGVVSWDDSSLEDDFQAQSAIIKQANTIKLTHVCRHYGIEVDEYSCIIRCPFKFHNDNTPSFKYFSKTNSFHCWGCKNNGQAVNFVALYENVSKTEAAERLLDSFESDEVDGVPNAYSKEKEELSLRFSAMVRNFLKKNNTPDALLYADKITHSFDKATRGRSEKRIVDADGMKNVIDALEKRIGKY